MERTLTLGERLQLFFVLLYGVTMRPRSLFYARITDFDAKAPTQGMWMNARAIQRNAAGACDLCLLEKPPRRVAIGS